MECDEHLIYQSWIFDSNGYIRNSIDQTKCFIPKYLYLASGTNIVLHKCPSYFRPGYAWKISSNGSIQNKKDPTLVMDVTGDKARKGQTIQLWKNMNSEQTYWSAHVWHVRPIPHI